MVWHKARSAHEPCASLRRRSPFCFGLAEGVGFEPTSELPHCRFSRPVPSTARPPFRSGATADATRRLIAAPRLWSRRTRVSTSFTPAHRGSLEPLLHPPDRARGHPLKRHIEPCRNRRPGSHAPVPVERLRNATLASEVNHSSRP